MLSNITQQHRKRIQASHTRSREYGVERERIIPSRILAPVVLKEKLERNQRLITIAGPFIQLLENFILESGYIILLTDHEGCILEMGGDEKTQNETRQFGILPGAYMSEKSIGSNAISIALVDNSPVLVNAAEHYVKAFHDWNCSAAPIHNEKGQVIGCLNLSGKIDRINPHTLGMVVASAKAIEYQVRSSFADMRLKETYRFVTQILNTLEFGVLATDVGGIILKANNLASGLLRMPINKIEQKNIAEFIPVWPGFMQSVMNNEIIIDEEVHVSYYGVRDSLNVNVYPLTDGDGTITGTVTTIRDMKRVYRIVNKYTGMEARYSFDDLIGESDEMKKIVAYCRNISDSPSTVLIQGESGTGKEVLAQSIHNYSSRRENGFVALNCGAIPEALIESELFGYTEGAFTSARKGGKPGKFELANGGTLFLDEIGEMPLDMQVKLLRALQEKSITRVGGDKTIPVDVRIIAATNKNLLKEVQKGKFRQDLYYRLSVIPVYIPPLRSRREDIPILINFFMNLKSVKLRKQVPEMDNRLFKKLMHYPWPGNVRELENFIEKYVNLDGNIDDLESIQNPEVIDGGSELLSINDHIPNTDPGGKKPDMELMSLDELEKIAISRTIIACDGNMTKVAKILGISRNALYQKVKKYEIEN
jgi:sigma-54 dependent transcriptional regulator, acetoin dehydrogenase operon transcriptional activator AcoR